MLQVSSKFTSLSPASAISQNVSRTQLCTEVYGVPCPQINNSKLCRLRQIANKKYKGIQELYLGWKLSVHAIPRVCTLNIFDYEISLSCGKCRKHHREPLFGHSNTFGRGLPVCTSTPLSGVSWLKGSSKTPATVYIFFWRQSLKN